MDKEKRKWRTIIGLVFLSSGILASGIELHSLFSKLSEMGRVVLSIAIKPTSEDERRIRRLTDDDLKKYENILREIKAMESNMIFTQTTDIPLGEWRRMANDLLQTDSEKVSFLYGKHIYQGGIKEDSGKTVLDLNWRECLIVLPGLCIVMVGLFILRSTMGRGSAARWDRRL